MGNNYDWERPNEIVRRFGPKRPDHPSIGKECQACNKPFQGGDYTTLITLGPGGSEESRERCRTGRVYNAVAIEVHWACATGEEDAKTTDGK